MRPHYKNSVLQKLVGLVRHWVEPARTVHDPERRRQARLLASILLCFLLITCGLFIVRLPVVGFQLNAENISRLFIVLVIWPLFQLTRRGQVRLVSLIGVLAGSLILFALAATDELDRTDAVLAYLVVVLLFGSLFLPTQLNIMVFAAQLAGLLMVGGAIPNATLPDMIAGPFSFHLTLGTIVILVGWHRNLLEHSRLEQLAHSEQRLQDVIASNIDGMAVIDEAGIIRFLNPAAIDLFDQTLPNLLGQPFGLPLTANQFTEITLAHTSGVRTIEMRVVPIRWNNAPAVLASLRDITVRKRTEDALRQSETLYHTLVETLPMNVFCKNAAGQFTFGNTLFCQTTGQAWAEIAGKTDFEIHPPDLAQKYRADDEQVLASDRIFETTEEYQTLGGAKRYVQTFKTALREADGRVSGILGIFWDVTERKRMEDALRDLTVTLEQRVQNRTTELQRANERLTELDRLKDEFLARIGHELRTPLTNIKLYLNLVENGKPEKRAAYLQTLTHETERLHVQIEDLLKITQLSQATLDLEIEPVDINELIAVRVAVWADMAARKSLDFRTQFAADLPLAAIDREWMLQAVTQLINNALHYTPTGSITLTTALRSATGGDADRWIAISVADTGPGITPDDLPHIFDRLYRGRAAADYKTPGTGIGLSISREIVEKLGGRLTVETQIGVGSTFTVWLPVYESKSPVKQNDLAH